MNPVVEQVNQQRRDTAYQQWVERIARCETPKRLAQFSTLIGDALTGGRVDGAQWVDLDLRIAQRRRELIRAAVDYSSAPDSPTDCPRCDGPMKRVIARWDDPVLRGEWVVDEQDECQSCGASFPVLLPDSVEITRAEARRRARLVVGHNRHVGGDHSRCVEGDPCYPVGRLAQITLAGRLR